MAQKLKNLRVRKVDFVDEGANQRADIKLLKNKQGEGVSDVDSLAGKLAEKIMHLFKSQKKVEKKAVGFEEELNGKTTEKILDEMYTVCYALQASLGSIITDEELEPEEMEALLCESVEDFTSSIKECLISWASGKSANIRKNFDEDFMLSGETPLAAEQKGELEEMLKIDKSKMTPEERTAYEEIVKKYAVEAEEGIEKAGKEPKPEEEEIEETGKKKECAKSLVTPQNPEPAQGDDIYKGLHPIVKAELESLKKFREDTETKELMDVAKKYEIIGKKPEELVPLLKSLRAAGGSAYNDMISVLDSAVAMTNASGVFTEIGKSGSYHGPAEIKKSVAETKIDQIAKSYMEKEPTMSMADAVAKAWENHPELMTDYEEEAGF